VELILPGRTGITLWGGNVDGRRSRRIEWQSDTVQPKMRRDRAATVVKSSM
jgi:hypothetical protein